MSFKTWLESFERDFPNNPVMLEMMLHEMPHTHFMDNFPAGFEFLDGAYVDLGFENLGLGMDGYNKASLAFGKTGVAVPGTRFRLRFNRPSESLVEPVDGTEEVELPPHWKQGVYVLGHKDQYTFIGKRVRPDQVGNADMSKYKEVEDGWVLA